MDRNERYENPIQAVLTALQGERADIWTALPGIVQSFDAAAQTCTIQPTVRARIDSPTYSSATMVADPSGVFVWDQLPVLQDCPVHFPKGGGCTLTFPVKKGDECLVVIASRCIDAWWAYGGIQNQPILRMHDLSDGFAFVGFSSKPTVVGSISEVSAQLRTDDGAAFVELVSSGANAKNVNIETPTHLNATVGGNITFNVTGNVSINAGGNASVTAGGNASVTASGTGALSASSWTVTGDVLFNNSIAVTGFAALNGGFGATGGSGSYSVSGTITGLNDIVVGGKSIGPTHAHSDPQGGNTGGVV